MFGSRSRLSFRPTGNVYHKNDSERVSPTGSSMSRKLPKIRIRNAFRSNRETTNVTRSTSNSPRNPLPLEVDSIIPMNPTPSQKVNDFQDANRSTPLSPLGEQKLRLMPKIAKHRCQGLLNDEQERELYTLLQQHKLNPFDDSMVKEVETKLSEYKRRSMVSGLATLSMQSIDKENLSKEPTGFSKLHQKSEKVIKEIPVHFESNAFNQKASMKPFRDGNRLLQEEDAFDALSQDKQQVSSLFKSGTLSENISLSERGIYDVKDVIDQAEEAFIENLFIEMCFFARLGFLQPPMCLRCVYLESIEGMEEDSQCQNFCVWRRNANEALHPTKLAGNLCMVECQAARRLIQGSKVNQHYWDHISRRLVGSEK